MMFGKIENYPSFKSNRFLGTTLPILLKHNHRKYHKSFIFRIFALPVQNEPYRCADRPVTFLLNSCHIFIELFRKPQNDPAIAVEATSVTYGQCVAALHLFDYVSDGIEIIEPYIPVRKLYREV